LHVLFLQPPRLELLAHLEPQLVHVERLRQVVHGAEAHGLHGRIRGREGGHHEDDDVAVDVLGHAQDVHAGGVGHLDVRQHQIEALAPQQLDGALAVLGHLHVVAVALEDDLQHVAHRLLIVHDQQPRVWRA
jgi:hypothetical protein